MLLVQKQLFTNKRIYLKITVKQKAPGYKKFYSFCSINFISSIKLEIKSSFIRFSVTYLIPLIPSEIGTINRELLINRGFDNIYFRPNQKVSKYLAKRFFIERGNPKVHWDAGINAFPINVALEKNIKLIFYAEHGESHYGGKILDNNSEMLRNLDEIFEHQIGDDPINWLDDNEI